MIKNLNNRIFLWEQFYLANSHKNILVCFNFRDLSTGRFKNPADQF